MSRHIFTKYSKLRIFAETLIITICMLIIVLLVLAGIVYLVTFEV